MLKLIGFFAEVEDNEAKLNVNTQIEIVFKFLTNEFVGFRATYNLGNKALTLTQLMKELQSYELMLNDGKLVQEKPKTNLVVGPSSSKGKQKAKEKKKPTKYSVPPHVDRKKAKKDDVMTHQVLCCEIEGSMLSFRVSSGVCRDILMLCRNVEACLEAIRFAKEMDFRRAEFKGDSLLVITKMKSTATNRSDINMLVWEAKLLVFEFTTYHFQHIHHIGNRAAHLIAKEGYH
ncbi:hypothetical protein Gotri_015630 [Gossypium trilobum]|uniref:RNase H type-1 domain-containing protein n=1 Tax=Gossypium trilobum TaxID=34281 RepID=A0A7J9E0X1_9ROSI|nr:hypothetical protein [Gossypium trilobum]